MERGILEYKIVGEFLVDIKTEFDGKYEKMVKVAELKRLEQGGKTIEEFVQEFRRVARESRYEKGL